MNSILRSTASVHRCTLAVILAAVLITVLGGCSGGNDKGAAPSAVTPPSENKISPISATASDTASTSSPKMAFDGDLSTSWSTGAPAPGWIQLDLGQPMTISKIRLDVEQTPAGPTTHEISGGPTPDSLTVIGTLDGNTTGNQWLELNQSVNNVRYLKITTLKSPSWVAWKEIEVYK